MSQQLEKGKLKTAAAKIYRKKVLKEDKKPWKKIILRKKVIQSRIEYQIFEALYKGYNQGF